MAGWYLSILELPSWIGTSTSFPFAIEYFLRIRMYSFFSSLITIQGVTALGAALVFVLPSNNKKFLGMHPNSDSNYI